VWGRGYGGSAMGVWGGGIRHRVVRMGIVKGVGFWVYGVFEIG
jgi:hypothetical protein